jgi:hypothetical protein
MHMDVDYTTSQSVKQKGTVTILNRKERHGRDIVMLYGLNISTIHTYQSQSSNIILAYAELMVV